MNTNITASERWDSYPPELLTPSHHYKFFKKGFATGELT